MTDVFGEEIHGYFGGNGNRVIEKHEFLHAVMAAFVLRNTLQGKLGDPGGKVLFFANGNSLKVKPRFELRRAALLSE